MSGKELIRSALKEKGYTVTIRTRNLVGGPKLFFIVEDEHGNLWKTHNWIRATIQEHFPKAHMSSGGAFSRTYAEY